MTTNANDIVFKDPSGRIITKEELQNATGEFDWEIQTTSPVPEEAVRLHELGRLAGQRGANEEAIDYFDQAARIAPEWPYPPYDAAFTYLLAAQFDQAYAFYKQVDALAPRGFFTAKTAVHSLEREMRDEFPKGTYLYFLSIEWADDARQRLQVVDDLALKVPTFAPVWKEKAALEDNEERAMQFLESGLALNPDAETKGFLLINKAFLLHRQGQTAQATDILGTLALDPDSPLDIEAVAKQSLAMILED